MPSPTVTNHHVWFVVPAWGHLTSAGALVSRMLEVVTSSIALLFERKERTNRLPKIGAKFENYIHASESFPKERFRLVAQGNVDPSIGPEYRSIAVKQLHESMLNTLRESVSPAAEWPRPTALLLDQFGANIILPQMKEICGSSCKTFMHWSLSSVCLYGYVAPSKAGGINDFEDVLERVYEDEGMRKGRKKDEILDGIMRCKNGFDCFNGTVLNVPGVGPMYDYEREMTNMPELPVITQMLAEIVKLPDNVDGVVSTSSEALEAEAIAACKQFVNLFAVGMQVSPRGWGKGVYIEDDGIRSFLEKHEKNSVLYIAFGSMCYPVLSPEQVPVLLEILQERNFPFILCLGGMMATNAIPKSTIQAINDSGKGWIQNSWVDQQAVLQHPNTGWFLSHGGWNSVSESLAQGVPMILWPLQVGDQPVNSALLSQRKEPVGFELLQIRQGVHRQPPYRLGQEISGDINDVKKEFKEVITRIRGPEGDKMRANAERLSANLKAEREKNTSIKELSYI